MKLAISKLKYSIKELEDIGSDISDLKARIESYKKAVNTLLVAPALLEQLIRTVKFIDGLSDDGIEPSDNELLKDAKTAIKKATE